MATAPFAAGLFMAWLFWRRGETIFGNIVGTGVIFSSAFGMICGLPYSSTYATALNVVPRSIPTVLPRGLPAARSSF